MGKLFGTNGIRGTANRYPITPDVALMAGKSIAKVLGGECDVQHKVVIGKDTRISGYMLETALTSGLVSLGMYFLLVGPLPTPGVAHLTKSMGCAAGVMLTSSHNPASDNGLKIFGADAYKQNVRLAELADCMREYPQRLISIPVPKKPPLEEIEGMNKLIADCESDFGEVGRNVIRYSGTENEIRVLLECSDVARAEDFAGRFESLIREQLCS